AGAVARVAERRQRARPALEIRRGEVVERELAGAQVTAREAVLDPRLALLEPVESRVELVLCGARDVKLVRQSRLGEGARAGELRARLEQPLDDHRHDQLALTRRRAVEQPPKLKPPTGSEDRRNMSVRERALHLQRLP